MKEGGTVGGKCGSKNGLVAERKNGAGLTMLQAVELAEL